MTTEGKVSPLPWKLHKFPGHVAADDGRLVANCNGYQTTILADAAESNYANAAFIVRAVNAHDRFVEAAEDALSMCRYLQQSPLEERPYGVGIDRVADKCRAALAAAKEGK